MKKYRSNNLKNLIWTSLFLLNPFISIVAFSINNFRKEIKLNNNLLFVFIAIFLGSINTTKEISSDLGYYYNIYVNVPNYNFIEYVFEYASESAREPLFSIINYISYYLFFGSWKLFILFLSAFIYYLNFLSLNELLSNRRNYVIVSAVICLAFFTQYFSLTSQIIRQVLASSILFYVIAKNIRNGRINYMLLISSIFIHSSVLLFVPLIFVKNLYKPIKFNSFLTTSLLLILFPLVLVLLTPFFSELFSFSSSISYVFDYEDKFTGSDGVSLNPNAIYFIAIPLITSILLNYFDEKSKDLMFIFNVFILLLIFVLTTSFTSPLVSYRYFFYTYNFIPFIFPVVFYNNNYFCFITNVGISLFMIYRFISTFESIIWDYANIYEILFYPILYLIYN